MAKNYNHCFFRIELNPSDKKKNGEENMMPIIVALHDNDLD